MRSRDPNTAAHPPNPKPIVDVPELHQAAMQVRGTSVAPQPDAPWGSGARQEPRSTRRHADYLHCPAARDAASTSGSSPAQAPQARAPNATSQHRWGGVYPKPTLLLSVRGCEWGSKPLSSDTYSTSQHGRMRMQVRLAAPGEHRGGFGTCGRRARGRTSPHQDPRPTPRAGNPRPGGGMRCTDSATSLAAGSTSRANRRHPAPPASSCGRHLGLLGASRDSDNRPVREWTVAPNQDPCTSQAAAQSTAG
jgi:hypothetical protein